MKITMRYPRIRFATILIIGLIVCIASGCSLSKRVVENISGNYMGGLNSDEAASKSQVCLYGLDECFQKVVDVLNSPVIDATILKINKNDYSMLVLIAGETPLEEIESIFEANSSDVGIYLTKIGPETTKVELRSLSGTFVDYAAKRIFPELQTGK